MTAFATPAGANSPLRLPAIMPGRPASAAVGISGAALRRVSALIERMRTLPARCRSSSGPPTFGVIIGMCPLARSATPGAEPLYGMCTMSGAPISCLNSSPARLVSVPGRAIGELARIGPGVGDELLEVARGHGFVDHDRGRRVAENIDANEILERIVGRIVHDRGNEHLRAGVAEQEGVTVRLRAGDLGGAGHAASAASILRHHRSKQRLHLLRPQPADDIGGATRRERNDEPDRAIGISKTAWP